MSEQGGIGIKRSLDELAATCLTFDYAEPPRLVSFLVHLRDLIVIASSKSPWGFYYIPQIDFYMWVNIFLP